jgi:hypothetical protein
MADTDTYDPTAGNEALADAKSKTADAAATQKQQQSQAEAPRSGAKPAQPAAKPVGGTDQNIAQKAGGAAKSAVMSSPVAQGVKAVLGSFKKGGTVPQTGDYKLHEGEEVVPNNGRASEYRKIFKSRGDAGKHTWGGK